MAAEHEGELPEGAGTWAPDGLVDIEAACRVGDTVIADAREMAHGQLARILDAEPTENA